MIGAERGPAGAGARSIQSLRRVEEALSEVSDDWVTSCLWQQGLRARVAQRRRDRWIIYHLNCNGWVGPEAENNEHGGDAECKTMVKQRRRRRLEEWWHWHLEQHPKENFLSHDEVTSQRRGPISFELGKLASVALMDVPKLSRHFELRARNERPLNGYLRRRLHMFYISHQLDHLDGLRRMYHMNDKRDEKSHFGRWSGLAAPKVAPSRIQRRTTIAGRLTCSISWLASLHSRFWFVGTIQGINPEM
jgi:hypothetical protein